MSGSEPWLLPAGIEEILPEEAARLERARRLVIDLFSSWGYDLIVPPIIEFLSSLLTGTGSDLDLQTFKLTDQISGRLMGVRADMTPQAARVDAHHLKRDIPVRLCYLGTVVHTRPDGLSGARSFLQVGAELYGHKGIESDVEILSLMLETLATVGVRGVHLDIGHVGIYRGLARQAGLSAEDETLLFDALQRKARTEVDELLRGWGIPGPLERMIGSLIDLNGGAEVLPVARNRLVEANAVVLGELECLDRLAAKLPQWIPDVPLHFDLAELRGYGYHTGVVFSAFVAEHGQEIARGGRYDDIGKVFGRARAATGFSTDLKTLVTLANEADAPARARGGIIAPYAHEPELLQQVRLLRASGERVIYALPGQPAEAWELGCDRALQREGGLWVVKAVGYASEG
ncbi:MAG: ATP phosphoribosyltransferase regulatory subunit [Gammaproteobacteria bacterium]